LQFFLARTTAKQAGRAASKQENEKKRPFDPFADTKKMIKRADRAKRKRGSTSCSRRCELKELAQQMNDEMVSGGS
jgi:hypothetical protein